MVWIMRTLSSHLYPGALLLYRRTTEAEIRPGDILHIEFADMSLTNADVVAADGDQLMIRVEGYRTLYGTKIDTKVWMIQHAQPVHDSLCYRVTGRPIRKTYSA
jgi:hypothetical protein